MNPIVVFIILIIALVALIRFLPFFYHMKEISEKPFVCPNCDHKFHVGWYRLFIKQITVATMHSARFRCPKCKKVDQCYWTGARD